MLNYLTPLAYWPMTEPAGVFNDLSGNGYTATPTGATYQNITLPGGTKIPLFDGTQEATYATPAFLAAANPNKGSIILLAKIADTEWEDDSPRTMVQLRDGDDYITINKNSPYHSLSASRNADGSGNQGYFYPGGSGDVQMLVLTWDSSVNQLLLYSDGELSQSLASGPNFVGALSAVYTRLCRSSAVSTDYHKGNLGHVGISTKVLTPVQIRDLFQTLYPNADRLMVIGDSKAVGAIGGWRSVVLNGIEASTGKRCILAPTGFCIGGHDVGEMRATIEANLANWTDAPLKIIINLGANDAVEPTPEASFKADYYAIIDALRAKWPGVAIYIAKIWRRDYPANCATLNGYIDTIIAHYADGVSVGPNEAVWLENGDDGVTYTSDGTHYNYAGQAQNAVQWLAVLGY